MPLLFLNLENSFPALSYLNFASNFELATKFHGRALALRSYFWNAAQIPRYNVGIPSYKSRLTKPELILSSDSLLKQNAGDSRRRIPRRSKEKRQLLLLSLSFICLSSGAGLVFRALRPRTATPTGTAKITRVVIRRGLAPLGAGHFAPTVAQRHRGLRGNNDVVQTKWHVAWKEIQIVQYSILTLQLRVGVCRIGSFAT